MKFQIFKHRNSRKVNVLNPIFEVTQVTILLIYLIINQISYVTLKNIRSQTVTNGHTRLHQVTSGYILGYTYKYLINNYINTIKVYM